MQHNRRNWVFSGETEGRNGKLRWVRLLDATDTPIRRHVKKKGEANPYDPEWEIYFEERLGVKMANNLQGKRQLLRLWQEQKGICPICNQKITKLTGWHNHHIVWRTHGGADEAENRVTGYFRLNIKMASKILEKMMILPYNSMNC